MISIYVGIDMKEVFYKLRCRPTLSLYSKLTVSCNEGKTLGTGLFIANKRF
jgi:hypothetical protein